MSGSEVSRHDPGRPHALESSLGGGILVSSTVALAFVTFAFFFLSRTLVTRPAKAILDVIERIARGDLKARVLPTGKSELAQLAAGINRMAQSLEDAHVSGAAADEGRAAVERRLHQAQVLAAAFSTADLLAHGIGSPLNTILIKARLSAGDPACPEDVRSSLETIAAQCDRIARVVADVLAISRFPRESSVAQCDLVHVAERAVAFIEPECERHGVSVKLVRSGQSAPIELDEDRTFQVIWNLCLNAIESQPRDGEVLIRILPHSGKTDGERHVAFDVEDGGAAPGAGPDALQASSSTGAQRLQSSSARIERAARDLRLTLARGLVNDAGGAVELTQGPRGGTICRVTLRAKDAPPGKAEAVIA